MEIIRTGATRIVILTENYAFKIPNFLDGYRLFLHGLLANLQEVKWSAFISKTSYYELCPVLWSIPFGLLVVMPRVDLMTEEEFEKFDAEKFCDKPAYSIPVEHKPNSFGWLDGRIVAIDYGN
jgi:hypothetical protein